MPAGAATRSTMASIFDTTLALLILKISCPTKKWAFAHFKSSTPTTLIVSPRIAKDKVKWRRGGAPAAAAGSGRGTQNPCYTGYVAKNLTLTIDENVLREARKIALDRNTSVNALVRDYLADLVNELARQAEEAFKRKAAAEELGEFLRENRVKIGPITCTRDELHERR